jgi:Epoxide hydrolase N terminus
MEGAMSSTEAIDTATEIRLFQIDVPQEELDELRRRIAATRWPEKETVSDATQGVQLATMQKLVQYWATEYDFGRVESRLNAFPHFVTAIDGLDIHFIQVRSSHDDALPLIVNVVYAKYMAARPQTLYGIADSPVGLAAWLPGSTGSTRVAFGTPKASPSRWP